MTVREIIREVNKINENLPIDVQAIEWKKGRYHRIYVNMFWTVRGGREKRMGGLGYFVVLYGEVVEFVEQQKGTQYSSSVSAEIIEKCKNLV